MKNLKPEVTMIYSINNHDVSIQQKISNLNITYLDHVRLQEYLHRIHDKMPKVGSMRKIGTYTVKILN